MKKRAESFTKKDLSKWVAEKHGGISIPETEKVMATILECLEEGFAEGFAKGEKVLISGFGTFFWKEVKKRAIVLPNGSKVSSKDRKRLWFQPAQRLKSRVNETREEQEG